MAKDCRHKYQPRYDEQYTTTVLEIVKASKYRIESAKNGQEPYLKSKTYVRDICIKCGEIKERK
jgi:hypothetical protein